MLRRRSLTAFQQLRVILLHRGGPINPVDHRRGRGETSHGGGSYQPVGDGREVSGGGAERGRA